MKKKISNNKVPSSKYQPKRAALRGSYEAGWDSIADAHDFGEAEMIIALNQRFAQWFLAKRLKKVSWEAYQTASYRFKLGFCRKVSQKPPPQLLLPTTKEVAVILSILNEGETIGRMLEQLQRLPLAEIIVVMNGPGPGSNDEIYAIARAHPEKLKIIHYDSALGFDVGRAVGAREAKSGIMLFLDGDKVIPAERLLPFIYAVERGADIALNNYSSVIPRFDRRDAATIMKEFVNKSMGRPDLKANSLTSAPHAISRRAVEMIGYRRFAVPPVAQAIAIQLGLNITAPCAVNVTRRNNKKSTHADYKHSVEQMIIGDHLEALHDAMQRQGKRLQMPDSMRLRQIMTDRGIGK